MAIRPAKIRTQTMPSSGEDSGKGSSRLCGGAKGHEGRESGVLGQFPHPAPHQTASPQNKMLI